MYMTIEADIENGWVNSPEIKQLPPHAHVLITLLTSPAAKRPVFGTRTSGNVEISKDAFSPLTGKDLEEWGLA